jgi:SAM-dependent methyltransferase
MRNTPSSTDATEEADLRAAHARIGHLYDTVPYEPQFNPVLDPDCLFGMGALFGCAENTPADFDVLDVGCGSGSQLERVAGQTAGRVIGADISQDACARATARCAPYGDRVSVLCTDLLDLSPEKIGSFDLIYHVGVLYIMPPAARRRMLELIARCLRPGGVVVISYYAGSIELVRAGLHRTLRSAGDVSQPIPVQIRLARERLGSIAHGLSALDRNRDLLDVVMQETASLDDTTFFHEVLNESFDAMQTTAVADVLREHGVHFLDYTTQSTCSALTSARERTFAADGFDLAGGGYRYAVFGRLPSDASKATARSPVVTWSTQMVRSLPDATFTTMAKFTNPVTGNSFDIFQGVTQAALDELTEGPLSFDEMCAGAAGRFADAGLDFPAHGEAQIENDLLELWQHRVVTPLWRPLA